MLEDALTSDPRTWIGCSLVSVTQVTSGGLNLLNETAKEMRDLVREKGGDERLKHKLLATVFYEASTRTSCSFQAAMKRLGGDVIHIDAGDGGNSSAGKKGETLADTIRCLECYVDVTALRHPVHGSVAAAAAQSMKPVLNAGDGIGEHPTQAMLDYFTICDELGEERYSKPVTIVMLGDLKHGRTVHSLAKLLARSNLPLVRLRFCSPKSLVMPEYIKEFLTRFDNIEVEECFDLIEAVQDADVLYTTRIQKERFESMEEYDAVTGLYIVDTEVMSQAPTKMVLMHPLPRVGEITEEVDTDPRAAYFRQMENGMFVRMALLTLILGAKHQLA